MERGTGRFEIGMWEGVKYAHRRRLAFILIGFRSDGYLWDTGHGNSILSIFSLGVSMFYGYLAIWNV